MGRFTYNEVLKAAKERGWVEGIDYELNDLIDWVNSDKRHSLDDILDEFENEPCY